MSSRPVLFISRLGLDATLKTELKEAGWEPAVADSLPAARQILAKKDMHVGMVLCAGGSAADGAGLDGFLREFPQVEWVGGFAPGLLGQHDLRDVILDQMFDHLTLPVDPQRLIAVLGHAYGRARLRAESAAAPATDVEFGVYGQSASIKKLLRQLLRVAKVDAPALICGESGSGKELIANAIHKASKRADGPFVVVNCGAIPATLIQSELFGHEKGSFTGADRQRRGLIEAANGGTLFLDEIGDLPLDMQTNLLRFLQEGTIDRIGANRGSPVDVRVIAATNVDLEGAVAGGAFRKDLYYRLNVLPLSVPPLRERGGDVQLLAEHFFHKFSGDRSRRLRGFSKRAMAALLAHDWPGNVRELINRIRRAMVLADGRLITPADLGLAAAAEIAPQQLPLDEARLHAEREAIAESLLSAGKNVTHAAKQLRISRMTLYRLMAKHRLSA
ncbi:MAG TPA: sigma-54 dependent transcriptional regulator [Rubrivivax sp.]|nr:sigma-54 dependent transcriptional regulator [Rubrivivax sp.]